VLLDSVILRKRKPGQKECNCNMFQHTALARSSYLLTRKSSWARQPVTRPRTQSCRLLS
jgi:hypothetical protein